MFHDVAVAIWVTNLALSVPLAILGFFTAYWMTYAWHSPAHHSASVFAPASPSPQYSFSIIIPVRSECYEVLDATVRRLIAQTHPRVQIIISVGYDDPETQAVVEQLRRQHGRLETVISRSTIRNKPTQLNAALAACTNDIVGLLDAESLSAPDLLVQVDAAFQQADVTVVQGGISLVNHSASGLALRSSLEYYVQHRSKAHYSARKNAILMGGNTVFFIRELLEFVGGWDATNLAEDAEIGLRIMASGFDVTIAYDPQLVTHEEAPETIRAWVNQRTRWNLGFLQTLTKGVWRELPTAGQRRFALWSLLQPTGTALTGVALGAAVFCFFAVRPGIGWTMLSFLPLLPTLVVLLLEVAALYIYGQESATRIRLADYVRLVVYAPLYQVLLSFAALRAAIKYVRKDFAWSKTAHPGAHLVVATS